MEKTEAQIEDISRFEKRLPKLEHENKVDTMIKEEMGSFLTKMKKLYEAEIRHITDEQIRLSARLETGLQQNTFDMKINAEKMEEAQMDFIDTIQTEIDKIKSQLITLEKHKAAVASTQSKQTYHPSVGQKR